MRKKSTKTEETKIVGWGLFLMFVVSILVILESITAVILAWTIVGALWALKGYALFYPNEFRSKRSHNAIWVEAFICGPIVFGFHVFTEGFQWIMFRNMFKDRPSSPRSSVE